MHRGISVLGGFTIPTFFFSNLSAGKYTNSSGSAACIACEAGRYNTDAATDASLHDEPADCYRCGAGKLSSADRTSCESCECVVLRSLYPRPHRNRVRTGQAGQYSTSSACVHCESGRWAPTAQNNECLECQAVQGLSLGFSYSHISPP